MLIIFAWVQFFVRNFLLSLIVSTALSIAIILLVRQLRLRKHNAINLKISQQTNFNIFKLILLTSPTLKIATIIKNMLPSQYNPKITKSDINFVKNDTTHTFTFCFINLDETKLLELIKTYTAKNLTIFCNSCDNSIYHLTKVFKNKTIEIVTLEQLFDIFNETNIQLDSSNIDLSKTKTTLKQIAKNFISRSKSKGYFVSGLVLLFTSIIIPFRLYYVIFSSALFALSLICKFKSIPKVNKSIFD